MSLIDTLIHDHKEIFRLLDESQERKRPLRTVYRQSQK